MVVEQVSEVGRGLFMEVFLCEEEDFVMNALGNREPVKILEDRGDVVASVSVARQVY